MSTFSLAPRVGFEPTTLRLTAGCSTAELTRITKFSRQIAPNLSFSYAELSPKGIPPRIRNSQRNNGIRRLPTLPGRCHPSTIGDEELNCCVRDGNRWVLFAIATVLAISHLFQDEIYVLLRVFFFKHTHNCISLSHRFSFPSRYLLFLVRFASLPLVSRLSPRPISINQLNTLLYLHL